MKKLSKREWESLLTSAARAEAATFLLKLILRDMGRKRRKRYEKAARAEAADYGVSAVIEETDWLFS